MVDLALYRQKSGEMVEKYMNRFKTVRNRCFIRMPESEFVKMTFNGVHFKVKDHFEYKYFSNLFDLGVRVTNMNSSGKEIVRIGHDRVETRNRIKGKIRMTLSLKRLLLKTS